MRKFSRNFLAGNCTPVTIRYREASSHRCRFALLCVTQKNNTLGKGAWLIYAPILLLTVYATCRQLIHLIYLVVVTKQTTPIHLKIEHRNSLMQTSFRQTRILHPTSVARFFKEKKHKRPCMRNPISTTASYTRSALGADTRVSSSYQIGFSRHPSPSSANQPDVHANAPYRRTSSLVIIGETEIHNLITAR